ncbi:MAG: pyridoxamine 5'-phosphate oxidase family protein [Haloferacaceae archaeon]
MKHVEYVYTVGMSEAAVTAALEESQAGVLALARDGSAYAVPVSHHYEDGVLHFRLADDDDSQKLAAAAATEEASFVCYGVDDDESWSVVAGGPLRRTGTVDAETSNERFGPLRIFDEAVEDVELVAFEMDVERIAGRRTPA